VPGVDLPTDPWSPPTNWLQTLLPISLPAGDHHLEAYEAPEDRRNLLIRINGQETRVR